MSIRCGPSLHRAEGHRQPCHRSPRKAPAVLFLAPAASKSAAAVGAPGLRDTLVSTIGATSYSSTASRATRAAASSARGSQQQCLPAPRLASRARSWTSGATATRRPRTFLGSRTIVAATCPASRRAAMRLLARPRHRVRSRPAASTARHRRAHARHRHPTSTGILRVPRLVVSGASHSIRTFFGESERGGISAVTGRWLAHPGHSASRGRAYPGRRHRVPADHCLLAPTDSR